MSEKVENLLKNSKLPGPRGNLELMYSFSKNASEDEINECLSYYHDNLNNSPEEFVVVCGIVGYCVKNQNDTEGVIKEIRRYASHNSWRIREAVAMGIQEIAENRIHSIINCLDGWLDGNEFEKRAVVAALCEPKLLKDKTAVKRILSILNNLTLFFVNIDGKLSGSQDSFRKALGYGWSVVIVSLPEEGKAFFEEIAENKNKHIRWIVKENLKKNRLHKMDSKWVQKINIMVED